MQHVRQAIGKELQEHPIAVDGALIEWFSIGIGWHEGLQKSSCPQLSDKKRIERLIPQGH